MKIVNKKEVMILNIIRFVSPDYRFETFCRNPLALYFRFIPCIFSTASMMVELTNSESSLESGKLSPMIY